MRTSKSERWNVLTLVVVSESEKELLERLKEKVRAGVKYTTEELSKLAGVDKSKVESLVRLLASKGLVTVHERPTRRVLLTDEARRYMEEGFPEELLVLELERRGGEAHLEDLEDVLGAATSIAITNAVRKKWIKVEKGVVKLLVPPSEAKSEEREYLRRVMEGAEIPSEELKILVRRGLVKVEEKKVTEVVFPEDPGALLEKVRVEIGSLTPELIVTGEWRRVAFRRYDVRAEPPRLYPGRRHFFVEFLELLRDVMKEMGFVEVEGELVETEFWTYDALYQPQHHPARSPTDTFYLAEPRYGVVPSNLAASVARAHEVGVAGSKGLGYKWSLEKAQRLILRSHTTSVSARVLSTRPKPPFRFFTIGRVYRVERVDPKHLPEFHQLDGIASEDGMGFKDLLGILAEFFERLGLKEYRFRPAYFPFTEPSAEGYLRIRGQWMEVLGCGMFRPELLAALGVDYPVAAWGMGLERIAMALYGLNDIRQLYSFDVAFLRSIPARL